MIAFAAKIMTVCPASMIHVTTTVCQKTWHREMFRDFIKFIQVLKNRKIIIFQAITGLQRIRGATHSTRSMAKRIMPQQKLNVRVMVHYLLFRGLMLKIHSLLVLFLMNIFLLV